MAQPSDARSLSELFSDLTRDITTLIRAELTLARTELSQSVSRIGRHAAMIAAGAVLACGGLYTVIAAAVLLLIRACLTPCAAARLVGLAVVAGGGLMATSGLAALRRERLMPEETINTLKETATWKSQTTR